MKQFALTRRLLHNTLQGCSVKAQRQSKLAASLPQSLGQRVTARHNRKPASPVKWFPSYRLSVVLPSAVPQSSADPSTSKPHQRYERVLYVAYICRLMSIADAEGHLRRLVPNARLVQVIGFNSKSYQHPKGHKHKGFGYVVLPRTSEVAAAAQALHGVQLGEEIMQVSVATGVPKSWTEKMLADEDELMQKKAYNEGRKAHRKRNDARRNLRHVSSLGALISALPPPGGDQILQQYQPIVPGGSDRAGDYVDWSMVPRACDPTSIEYGSEGQQAEAGRRGFRRARKRNASGSEFAVLDVGTSPEEGGGTRGLRKRVQVESFAVVLEQLLQYSSAVESGPPLRVVDFGSGTGNLVLPLAALFPDWQFHAVDRNARAVMLLLQRARTAGLKNVDGSVTSIQEYSGDFDMALALHACGSATDHALLQAVRRRAAFIVSPCCVGKLKLSLPGLPPTSPQPPANTAATAPTERPIPPAADHRVAEQGLHRRPLHALPGLPSAGAGAGARPSDDLSTISQLEHSFALDADPEHSVCEEDGDSQSPGWEVEHPRSRWMAQNLPEPLVSSFAALAAAADYSHRENHSHPELAQLAKANIEMDRLLAAAEAGYRTALLKLLRPAMTTKSDLLVGVPAERIASGGYGWSWR